MDSYRPSRDSDNEGGFRIKGRASGPSRSPTRRRHYHDQDMPERRYRDSREQSYSGGDDYYYNRRYASTSNHYHDEYYEEPSMYDEPLEEPPSTGEEDVSDASTPWQILLIRGLASKVDEKMLSKGLEKLYQDDSDTSFQSTASNPPLNVQGIPPPGLAKPSQMPAGAPLSTLKRVYLIRDRITDKSLQYGFAEYHSVGDAKAALEKAEKLDDRCTIASKRITVTFPHLGVFPPVHPGQPHDEAKYSFEMKGQPRMYRDARYYATVLEVNTEPPGRPKSSSADEKKDRKPAKKKRKTEKGGPLDNSGGEKNKKAKTAPTLATAQMQKWQQKQAELRGETLVDGDDGASENPATSAAPEKAVTAKRTEESYVFHGLKDGKQRKCCLLCGTNLADNVTPTAHVKLAPLHASSLEDQEKVKKALERIKAWGETVTIEESDFGGTKPQYRDRAKERRQDEVKSGLPRINLPLKSTPANQDRSVAEPAPDSASTTPSYGMGLKMLQKAGWSEGQGLGSGTGIAAPIEQSLYAAGVGLGHEGSKKGDAVEEASRMTRDDRGGFLRKTKEVARERFERME